MFCDECGRDMSNPNGGCWACKPSAASASYKPLICWACGSEMNLTGRIGLNGEDAECTGCLHTATVGFFRGYWQGYEAAKKGL